MARRRVFRTRVEGPICPNRRDIVGQKLSFQKATESNVNLTAEGVFLGNVKPDIGPQITIALDRGQVFTITVENTSSMYNHDLKEIGTCIDIKVEYLLQKGDPTIKAPTASRLAAANPRSFFTKVAGLTYEGRQRIVERCSAGERLRLVREPDNPKDPDAIKILRENGEHLGYVRAEVADGPIGLASRIDQGERYECTIKDITGGGDKWLGVNIEIKQIKEPESFDALVERRLRELAAPRPLVAIEAVSAKRSTAIGTRNESSTTNNTVGWVIAAVITLVVIVAFLLGKS